MPRNIHATPEKGTSAWCASCEGGESRGDEGGQGQGYARCVKTKSGNTPERMKEKRERVINRSGDMDLESEEEEEWDRELGKAEATLNLHPNTPP